MLGIVIARHFEFKDNGIVDHEIGFVLTDDLALKW